MNSQIDSEMAIIEAQRYAVSNALSAGTSSRLLSTDVNGSIDMNKSYNPIFLRINDKAHLFFLKTHLFPKSAYQREFLGGANTDYFSYGERFFNGVKTLGLKNFNYAINKFEPYSSFETDTLKHNVNIVLYHAHSLEANDEREASRYLMREIERKIKNREFLYLNEMLKNISTIELSPRSLVSTLRSTYRVKNTLDKWDVALVSVAKYLTNRGLDSKAWLVGLNNDK